MAARDPETSGGTRLANPLKAVATASRVGIGFGQRFADRAEPRLKIEPAQSRTLRLRAGYTFGQGGLLYGGAGYAQLDARITIRDALGGPAPDRTVAVDNATLSGFAGMEIPLRDAWTLRIEAEYASFDGVQYSASEDFFQGDSTIWTREARYGNLETVSGRLQLVYRLGSPDR